jgi:hypothetical protein
MSMGPWEVREEKGGSIFQEKNKCEELNEKFMSICK